LKTNPRLEKWMNPLSRWVFRPIGAAFIGVYVADIMSKDLPGFEKPLMALLLSAAIVMSVCLLEESNAQTNQRPAQ